MCLEGAGSEHATVVSGHLVVFGNGCAVLSIAVFCFIVIESLPFEGKLPQRGG